jgi:hypothetical protein
MINFFFLLRGETLGLNELVQSYDWLVIEESILIDKLLTLRGMFGLLTRARGLLESHPSAFLPFFLILLKAVPSPIILHTVIIISNSRQSNEVFFQFYSDN